jgi:hypothetical protein
VVVKVLIWVKLWSKQIWIAIKQWHCWWGQKDSHTFWKSLPTPALETSLMPFWSYYIWLNFWFIHPCFASFPLLVEVTLQVLEGNPASIATWCYDMSFTPLSPKGSSHDLNFNISFYLVFWLWYVSINFLILNCNHTLW